MLYFSFFMHYSSGVLAGLVAITPGSGFVAPWASLIFGAVSAGCCNLAVRLKERLGYDDQLDAFGLHAVGASVGTILTGVFHQAYIVDMDGGDRGSLNSGLIEGGYKLIGYQAIALVSIAVYAFVMTYLILTVMNLIPGISFQVTEEHAEQGFDMVEMGEGAYDYSVKDKDGKWVSRYMEDGVEIKLTSTKDEKEALKAAEIVQSETIDD
jgi:Amt family ammonium transporter